MATNQQPPDVNAAITNYLNRAQWSQQLALDYADTIDRLLSAYQRILPRLQQAAGDFNVRLTDYVNANDGEMPTGAAVRGWKQYQDLLTRVEDDMQQFSVLVSNEAGILSERGIQTGIDAAEDMVLTTAGDGAGLIASVWNRPAPEAIAAAIGYVDSDAFRSKASTFGANASENISDTIIAGIAQGKGQAAISRLLTNWLTVPYSWAVNTVATTQMYSFRSANHETYRQNESVLDGWIWWASLGDPRTCLSCINQHGSIHPLSEDLSDHHRGRCTPLPIVKGSTWQNSVQRGSDWFAEQPSEFQREVMGRGKHDLYTSGGWDWSRVSVPYENDIFLTMLREATLQEMAG